MANWKETLKKLQNKSSKTRAKAKNKTESRKHTIKAMSEAKKNGGIKNIQKTKNGTQITYKNGTGYYIDN